MASVTFDPTYAPHSGKHRRQSVISRPGTAAAARRRRCRNGPRGAWLRGMYRPRRHRGELETALRHRGGVAMFLGNLTGLAGTYLAL